MIHVCDLVRKLGAGNSLSDSMGNAGSSSDVAGLEFHVKVRLDEVKEKH